MMKLLAPVENIKFDIEEALEKQNYAVLLPFSGMDSNEFSKILLEIYQFLSLLESAFPVCELFVKSKCDRGSLCPFRHVKGNLKKIVIKSN